MNIQLEQVNIQNLRSIKKATVHLRPFSIMFGMNDSGKSNFLLALGLALGNRSIDEKDIFCSQDTPYSSSSVITIDLKFIPVDDAGECVDTFNDLWALHLGDSVMVDDNDKDFFAFRTTFEYDTDKEEYIRDRMLITKWREDEVILGNTLRYRTLSAFEFIYIDAHRDMASDIRDKSSVWSKHISKLKMSPEAKIEIESSLGLLSDRIMEESPFLQQVSTDLASATNTRHSNVEINPVTRSVDELYKGLDIYIKQNASASIPISNLGLGTRSRAVFASQKSIINKRLANVEETPYFCIIAFEEPESHIHPHSQRKLVKDFSNIQGQRVLTTHSPYILSSSKLCNLVYVALRRAETCFNSLAKLELTPEELRQIDRFVLNTRGELLFADIAILAEGETEEQALQIFFKDYFGCEPFEMGVSFIGVGGKNYLPFLRVLECIGTDWLIFSDGEPAAINDLQATIKKLKNLPNKPSLDSFNNIIVLSNSHDFETYLLDAGYSNEIITAINEYEGVDDEHQDPYFDYYVRTHNRELMRPCSTGIRCEICGEMKKIQTPRDYLSDGGQIRAISDCMKSGKTKYAVPISRIICSSCEGERKYPMHIKTLLEQISIIMEARR